MSGEKSVKVIRSFSEELKRKIVERTRAIGRKALELQIY